MQILSELFKKNILNHSLKSLKFLTAVSQNQGVTEKAGNRWYSLISRRFGS